jgi:hypothetical protein
VLVCSRLCLRSVFVCLRGWGGMQMSASSKSKSKCTLN